LGLSGIATWEDPIDDATVQFITEKDGGDWSKVELVPGESTDATTALQMKMFDAIFVYRGWDYIHAQTKKVDTNFFLLTDYIESQTDICFYDYQTEEISVLLAGQDELTAIAQTDDGTIYLAQPKNNIIYRYNEQAEGKLEYFAGAKFEKDFVDGPIPKFYQPLALTTDGQNLYVWDYHMLRKIMIDGGVITDTVSLSGQADQEDEEKLTGAAYEVSYSYSEKTGINYVDGQVYICQPDSSYIRVVEE